MFELKIFETALDSCLRLNIVYVIIRRWLLYCVCDNKAMASTIIIVFSPNLRVMG